MCAKHAQHMETPSKHRIIIEVPLDWLPEMEEAKTKAFTSRHRWILRSIRTALNTELGADQKSA